MEDKHIERLERVMQAGFETLADLIRETNSRLDRHEQVLVRVVEGQDRHEQVLGLLVDEVRGLGDRIDNILTGPLGGQVRDHEERLSSLEARLSSLESRQES